MKWFWQRGWVVRAPVPGVAKEREAGAARSSSEMSIAVHVQVLHEAEDHIVNVRQTRRRVSWEVHEAEDNRNCPMGKISVPCGGDGRLTWSVHAWQEDPLSDLARFAEKRTHIKKHEKEKPRLGASR